jgi:hypothetical protein
MRSLPTARRLGLAALLVAAVAGCAGSGYSYHSNKDENLYFKVPDDWTVFDTGELLPDASGVWLRGFVGGARAVPDAVPSISYGEPRGYVQISAIGASEREQVSIESLRSVTFGMDPLTFAQSNPNGPVSILDYGEVVLDGGAHGVHIRVQLRPEDGSTPSIIDQTVLVDKATRKQYLLNIGCSAACWDAHHRQIEAVIDSWTLEAT